MFATIARAARAGTVGPIDAPGMLAWQAVGAAWAIWLLGWAVGLEAWYWGGLLVTGALWVTTAAVDRLERSGALTSSTAALLRTGALAFALVWAPRAVAAPFEDLRIWLAAVAVASAAHVVAPWGARSHRRRELYRCWVADMRAAAGFAGIAVGVPIVVIAMGGQLGWSLQPETFVALLAGAVFCVGPTVLTARSSDLAQTNG